LSQPKATGTGSLDDSFSDLFLTGQSPNPASFFSIPAFSAGQAVILGGLFFVGLGPRKPVRDMSHPERLIDRLATMFRCQLCQCVVPSGTSCKRLVLEWRIKKYPFRSKANSFFRTDEKGKRSVYHTDDPGGEGVEIAKEALVCPACAARDGKS
jgi:hypothetical protein